jgi:hypothetical protein
MIPVIGQGEKLAVDGDLVIGQRLALGLEETDQKFAGFLLDVGALVRHAQHRQIARNVGARIRDDIEVLGRDQRHVDASHAADLARPQPCAVDDELGAHRAIRRVDSRHPSLRLADSRHLGVFKDAHAALASRLGQRLRHWRDRPGHWQG